MKFFIPLKDRAQSELIKRGRCVADAKSLAEAKRVPYPLDDGHDQELVTCACRRVYVYNKQLNSYRRARLDEVQS